MAEKYTADELKKLGRKELVAIILSLQDQISALNDNMEKLIEMIRVASTPVRCV